jgi:D-alanyl-D-alanine carboxypeptidase/D-alanyl-D-alanine-endopeptidase (penicillin-binding protein 4)
VIGRAAAIVAGAVAVAAATTAGVVTVQHSSPATTTTMATTTAVAPTTVAPTTTAPTTTALTTTTVAPTTTTRSAAVTAVAARIDPIMAANVGCVVVADQSGVVYQHAATVPLVPASTQKLLVAAAALAVLGPSYRFTTTVMASAPPIGGRVGELWLVGGGDPLLATPAFAAWWTHQARYAAYPLTSLAPLAAAVRAAGIVSVPGGVHGDDARYDRQRLIPTWPADTESSHDIAPLSALTLNEGYEAWTPKAVVPPDPAASAASALSQLLRAPAGADSVPPASAVVVAKISSAPLAQIIGAMLRASDNQIAELLVKELGYHARGVGTTTGGLAVVESTDAGLGISLAGVVMHDGSGLDHGNRSTCATLLAALDAGRKPGLDAIATGLAVAGQSGTLVNRFRGTPEAGTLHAKSGSIDDAGGLVGFFGTGPAPVRFAMLFNQPMSYATLLAREDAVIAAIAPYAATR